MKHLRLVSANIVVLANAFNPSIATKEWLFKHIVSEEPTDYVSTPLVSAYKTDDMEFLLDQTRLQITGKTGSEQIMKRCATIVRSYVTELPHTPYTAIGFNYSMELQLEPDNMERVLQQQFAAGLCNLDREFSHFAATPNLLARKGDALIRVTVEPMLDMTAPMSIKVNYHYDCKEWAAVDRRAESFGSTGADALELMKSILVGC